MTRIRRKRRRRRAGGGLAGLLIIVVMALYIPAMWKWFFTRGVESGIIQQDTLEVKVPITGLFIRDESLLRASAGGSILPEAHWGERLPTGGVVASFLEAGSEDMYRQYDNAVKEVKRRVADAAAEAGDAKSVLPDGVVGQEAPSLALAANAGDIAGMGGIRAAMDRRMSEQILDLLEDNRSSGYLEAEKSELTKLKNRIGKALTPVRAVRPGIVCYQIDGFESVFTPASRNSLTLGAISMVTDKQEELPAWVTPKEISVGKDEPYGKLVQNEAAWFLFSVDAGAGRKLSTKYEAAKLAKELESIDVEIEGLEGRIHVTIERMTPPVDGEKAYLVVGKLTRRVEQTMEMRKVDGELVLQSLTGLKVPQKALFNRNSVDGTADIMLLKMNRANLRRVKVLGIQDAWAVIGNLDEAVREKRVNAYDLYLQNPDGVMDGQVMQN